MDTNQQEPGVPVQLVDELAQEARNAFEHGKGTVAISLLSAVFVLWLLRVLSRAAARISERLGVDRRRRVSRLARSVQLVVLLLLVGEFIQSAARVAPVWVAALVVFVLIPLLLWTSGVVHDLVGGAMAHLRLQLAEGDYVCIGDKQGVLTKLGATYLSLRDEAGTTHCIPGRALTGASVAMTPERRAVPVVLELATLRPLTLEELTRLRESAATSPYRAISTPLKVAHLAAPHRVEVCFSVWSQAAVGPARLRVERALARIHPITPPSEEA